MRGAHPVNESRSRHGRQFFCKGIQVFSSVAGNYHKILYANTAKPGHIYARFHREHHSRQEYQVRCAADKRRFVYVKTDTVTGSMREIRFITVCADEGSWASSISPALRPGLISAIAASCA